jgi:hypothetical protein
MMRARWYLVGTLVLVALVGCARNWVAEREAWRHEAEVACLKSGSVKEGPAIVRADPIQGPGMCGADFPLKVAALGDSPVMGFADMRPPGSIPGASNAAPTLRWPVQPPPYPSSAPSSARTPIMAEPDDAEPPEMAERAPPVDDRYVGQPRTVGQPRYVGQPRNAPMDEPGDARGPLSLTPPGVRSQDDRAYDGDPATRRAPAYEPPGGYPGSRREAPQTVPSQQAVPALGPRGPEFTGSVAAAAVKPTATLACPMVSALDRWIIEAVQPASVKWFGQPVAEIRQISAYSCRGMNGNPNSRISEHAFGNALDIASFTLTDGRKITVKNGWKGLPEEQGFLHDIQLAACNQFTTVLAPGSNVYHYDHIHVDLMRRSSRRSICQPQAIPGDVVAAKARGGRYAGAQPDVTGSVAKPTKSKAAYDEDEPLPPKRDLLGRFLRAIPGED